MGAQVIQLFSGPSTEEVDVIVRRCGPHKDLRDQVGILFLDRRGNGPVFEATFEPIYKKLRNAVLPLTSKLKRSDTHIELTDDENVKWKFEINSLGEEDDL